MDTTGNALERAKAAIARLGDILDYLFLDVKSHGVIYSTMDADQTLKLSQRVLRKHHRELLIWTLISACLDSASSLLLSQAIGKEATSTDSSAASEVRLLRIQATNDEILIMPRKVFSYITFMLTVGLESSFVAVAIRKLSTYSAAAAVS